MAKITVDADKLKVAGEELNEIAKDYKNLVNELYEKIKDIQNQEMWVSESEQGSASNFIARTLKDKESTYKLGNSMKSLGDKVISYANNLNSTADNKI